MQDSKLPFLNLLKIRGQLSRFLTIWSCLTLFFSPYVPDSTIDDTENEFEEPRRGRGLPDLRCNLFMFTYCNFLPDLFWKVVEATLWWITLSLNTFIYWDKNKKGKIL